VESELEPEIPADDFKIFADKTRISILKALNARRYTISELSRMLNLSKPTILYHIKILENAGHVRKIKDSRKWIYYELRDSGKFVLRWRKIKVILPVIGAAIMAIIAVVAVLLRPKKVKISGHGCRLNRAACFNCFDYCARIIIDCYNLTSLES